ncbi:hypothetical protein GJ496_011680 [Pomphorhynchus laevis]|nr:hypothetical protein GJ496_011680 [Pomphorhynchus laevis]
MAQLVWLTTMELKLWLALARLESYENAQRVLNRARENIPTDRQIWFMAAKLEEAHGNLVMVDKIIDRAVTSLKANMVEINRDQWLKDAIDVEKGGSPQTCRAIIRIIAGLGVEPEDEVNIWLEDANNCAEQSAIESARALYAFAITRHPSNKNIWLDAAYFEKTHGDRESLENILQESVKKCPKVELLWLMLAKSKWMAGDVSGARDTLASAFSANANSEEIWLAAVKLESENNEHNRALKLLSKARSSARTARVFMKSAKLEWSLENLEAALDFVNEGLRDFPEFTKLWMMKGQLLEEQNKIADARRMYAEATRRCPDCNVLWILAARLEIKQKQYLRARALLEGARMACPKNDEIWLEAVKMELEAGHPEYSANLLARGLQDCPNSGRLWAQSIYMEMPVKQKTKCVDALKNCEHDTIVILAVARYFWSRRSIDKARGWLERCVKLDPDYGDAHATRLCFEMLEGDEEKQAKVKKECVEAEPRHGSLWCSVSKAIKNWKLKNLEILLKVADCVDVPS